MKKKYEKRIRMNKEITAPELRVLDADGSNIGVMPTEEALKKAEEAHLDLLETSAKAKPPIVKIMDYGRYAYDEKKKQKELKAKAHKTETKNVQIKIGTGEHDLNLKAKNISKWLKESHRVKIDLFLRGRAKYMKIDFLKERLDRVLHLVTEEYKVADAPKKSHKGLTIIIEKK
ncbi:translation initiation factor IF-3 [Patescibacteria group bacterium]